MIELALDPQAPQQARDHAVRTLGFAAGQTVRVIATEARLRIVPVRAGAEQTANAFADSGRVGVGSPVVIEEVAVSADQARLA